MFHFILIGLIFNNYHCRISDGETLDLFRSVFRAVGRGRRPSLPKFDPKAVSRKVFLDLYQLKVEVNASWDMVTGWTRLLLPGLPLLNPRRLMEKITSEFMAADNKETFLESCMNLDIIGPFCTAHNIFRSTITEGFAMSADKSELCNGAIVELVEVYDSVFEILHCLYPDISTQDWKATVHKINTQAKRLRVKSKNKRKLGEFLKQRITYSTTDELEKQDQHGEHSKSGNGSVQCGMLDKENVTLKVKMQKLNDENDKVKLELQCSEEMLSGKKEELSKLESDYTKLKEECEAKNKLVTDLEGKMCILTAELNEQKELAKSGRIKYNAVRRKAKYLSEKEKRIEHKLNKHDSIQELQLKVDKLKRQLERSKRVSADYLAKKRTSVRELTKTKIQCATLEGEILTIKDCETFETRSDDVGHPYSFDVEKCAMELSGELDVPTNKCSKVIQTVAKWVFGKTIKITDLPSTSTVGNMLDRAQCLSKFQVAEGIVDGEMWDLHSDGTTRDGKKFVGTQVILDTGRSLSTGFKPVAVEDSSTLLDNAIVMIEELCDMYDADNREHIFKSILQKMFAVMSDRASVNKAFNEKLSNYRKSELGDETVDIHYLYCNAHFLLGLSNVAESVLKREVKTYEDEVGYSIGRDALSKFRKFSSGESGPARYVRLACDILGPRGDEKNGCRMDWEGYCSKIDKKSSVTSFRMNRFNNFFEGAAALCYHRNDIIDFLTNFKQSLNLKVDSIFHDAQSDELNAFVRALGILYYKVTGPFWKMLNGNINYVDLYKYVQKMLGSFERWSNDPSELLLESCKGLFDDFCVEHDEVSDVLFGNEHKHETVTLNVLKQLMHGFIDVTKRQLNDFLPGGKFSEEASLELRRSMTHCKLTNLISEHEFGDLDYSQYRRRHASLHFHSSIQMVKRNKTISVWLNSKSIQNQNTLLLKAREQGISLRKKHAEQEKHVIEKVTAKLEATHRQKMEKEANHIELKRAIIESVQLYEGPCKSAADVDQLLNRLSGESETKKKEVLKQEIKYLKVVLGVKDSRLIFGKKDSVALAAGLKGVLSATDVADSMEVDLEVERADCNVHAATGAPATGASVRGKKRKASTGETNPNKTFRPGKVWCFYFWQAGGVGGCCLWNRIFHRLRHFRGQSS